MKPKYKKQIYKDENGYRIIYEKPEYHRRTNISFEYKENYNDSDIQKYFVKTSMNFIKSSGFNMGEFISYAQSYNTYYEEILKECCIYVKEFMKQFKNENKIYIPISIQGHSESLVVDTENGQIFLFNSGGTLGIEDDTIIVSEELKITVVILDEEISAELNCSLLDSLKLILDELISVFPMDIATSKQE